jgi:predicted TPR repeat methyltransferase
LCVQLRVADFNEYYEYIVMMDVAQKKQQVLSLVQQGRLAPARQIAAELVAADSHDLQALWMLGNINEMLGRFQDTEKCARKMIQRILPDLAGAYGSLGRALLGQQRNAEAADSFREALKLDPASAADRYLLAALGEAPLPSPSETAYYVTSLFDMYATFFDDHIRKELKYEIPEVLRSAVESALGESRTGLDILDLGCGTGLCGPLFRKWARTLTGVDLSAGMLEKARQRKVYDELIHGDLLIPLNRPDAAFDVVIAADVFVYIGALEDVFERCRAVLRPSGIFAFSIEAHEGEEDYLLRPNTRFAHSARYITDLTQRSGLKVVVQESTTVRYEHGNPVAGYIFLLK